MEDRPEIDIILAFMTVEDNKQDGFTSTELYEAMVAQNKGIPLVGRNKLGSVLKRAVEAGKLEAAWVMRTTAWGHAVRRQGYRVKAQ